MPTRGRRAALPPPGWTPRIVRPPAEVMATAAWRGPLARLNVRDENGVILKAGPLGACPYPIPVTLDSGPGNDLVGSIDELWIEPGEPAVLYGRGRAAGVLAQAIGSGRSVPVSLDLHDGATCIDVHAHIRYGWGVWRATADLGGEAGTVGCIAAEDDFDRPVPFAADGGKLAMPRRLREVPVPLAGEDLAGWVARVAATWGVAQGRAMDVLGLEPGKDPDRRLRLLTPGRLYEQTGQRFAAATGLDPAALVDLVQAAAELRRRTRTGTPEIRAARVRLAALLKDSMQRSCVPGSGGYGGSMSVIAKRLSPAAIDELRAGMRRAGRELGWKTSTSAYSLDKLTTVSVNDNRRVPAAAAELVTAAISRLMEEAGDRAAGRTPGPPQASDEDRERAERFSLDVEAQLTAILGDAHAETEPAAA